MLSTILTKILRKLALSLSLSLSLPTQFVCVRSRSTIMSLERKCIQQLCRIKRVSRGCRIVHASQAFQTTMLFPMVCDPQPLDMIIKNKKGIHRSFKPCIKNFCKKDKSVRDEEEHQQCTGKKKKFALAHRLDLILHDPARERNLLDRDRLDLCIMYVM